MRGASEVFFRVALGAVGFHVLLALQARDVLFAPVRLSDITRERIIPVLVDAVAVFGFEAPALAVMADGATKVIEFMTALPAAIFLLKYSQQQSSVLTIA